MFKTMSNILFGGSENTTSKETSAMLSARMRQSSKLNLRDSDIVPLEADPMKFSYLYYPQEVSNMGDGHYIEFDIFENVLSPTVDGNVETYGANGRNTFNVEEAVEKLNQTKARNELKQSYLKHLFDKNGNSTAAVERTLSSYEASPTEKKKKQNEINTKPRDKFPSTHKKLSQSIILYTPPENKFSYSAEYENAETGALGGLVGTDSFMGALEAGGAALQNMLSSAIEMISPGIKGLQTRAFGVTTNPNMELAFKSVPFREFTFPFTFAPKNKKELEQVHKIIQAFKFHMAPGLTSGEGYFITPSQFEMRYMYKKGENGYIPKISKCVLKSMTVDYSPNGKFTTLKPDETGASPQIIKMDLSFTEMGILTKENLFNGDY